MKKIISIVTVICILMVMVTVNASHTFAETTDGYVIDFTKPEGIDTYSVVPKGDSIISYDEVEQSLKITASDINQNEKWDTPAKFIVGGKDSSISEQLNNTADYPVFAFYIKSDDYCDNETGAFEYMAGEDEWIQFKSPRSTPEHAVESQWTLVTVDLSAVDSYYTVSKYSNENFIGYYQGFAMSLLATSYAVYEHDFWIQWMGVFSTAEAAAEYQINNPPANPNNLSTDGLIYDFSNEMNKNAVATATGDDTILSYDKSNQALKVTATDKNGNNVWNNPGRFVIGGSGSYLESRNISATDYPVFAMYIKADNIVDNNTGTFKYQAGGAVAQFKSPRSTPDGSTKSDWNLIVYDLSQKSSYYNQAMVTNLTGSYKTFDITLLSSASALNYSKDDHNFYIKWMGVFASISEVNDYIADRERVFDFTDRNNTEIVNAVGDTSIKYDEIEKALKITAHDKNNDGAWQNPGNITIGGAASSITAKSIATEKYPVFAMYIKANNYRDNNTGAFRYMAGGGNWVQFKSPRTTPDGAIESQWTLVTYDLSTTSSYYNASLVSNLTDNYQGLNLTLLNNSYEIKGYDFYVQWMGMFESIEEANQYCSNNPPANPNNLSTEGIIYDFSNEMNRNAAIVSSNDDSMLSYDSSNQALKVTATDKNGNDVWNNPGRFVIGGSGSYLESRNISATDYPVFAMYIKADNITDNNTGAFKYQAGGSVAQFKSPRSTPDGSTQSGWNLIVYDLSQKGSYYNQALVSNLTGSYKSFDITLLSNSSSLNYSKDDHNFYIKWMGVFASVEDVNRYLNGEESTPVIPGEPGLLYDFTDESLLQNAKSTYDTEISFDPVVGTMKLSAGNFSMDNPISFLIKPDKCAINDYPVLAIRLRTTDPQIEYNATYFNGTVLGDGEVTKDWWTCSNDSSDYNDTTKWQTIIIDTSNYYNAEYPNNCFSGDWYSMAFSLATKNKVAENDAVYVQWVGVFSSVTDANLYSENNSQPARNLGDVNGDGDADVRDLVKIKKYLAGNVVSNFSKLNANCYDDFIIDGLDLVSFRKILLGVLV